MRPEPPTAHAAPGHRPEGGHGTAATPDPERYDAARGEAALARLGEETVDHRFKGLPPDAEGSTVRELAAARRNLFTDGFTTPVLALLAEALDHNLRQLAAFTERHGLALAPHGKTSMAPQLLVRQLAHGAWGITAAVPSQVRVYRAFGIRRVLLANELVDPAALRWLARALAADPAFRCLVYVDSEAGVTLMDRALRDAGAPRPLEVLLEVGVPGGRTGVREQATALRVAAAVAATDTLRLVGVAGYEGEIPDADEPRVRRWLRTLLTTTAALDGAGHFAGLPEIVVSAGGSAWFDVVADVLAETPQLNLSAPVLRLLRSGAYVSHDDGHYRRLTPFNRRPDEGGLEPALRLWAQVVSRPEPGRAFLNAGNRDAPQDLGLPVPLLVRSARDGVTRPAHGLRVTRLADQHAFMTVAEGASPVAVGDWVALGMSHPCTIFDRWQLVPLVTRDGTVTDYVRTFF